MNKRIGSVSTGFIFRMVVPIVVISALPLVAGLLIAWKAYASQKTASKVLALDVKGMRAGEELAIDIRDIRNQLQLFMLTGERQHLQLIPGYRQKMADWIIEAENVSVTRKEQELITRVKQGYQAFFSQFDRIVTEAQPDVLKQQVRAIISDPLANEILEPAQAYLDFNEEEIKKTDEDNRKYVEHMVMALLLLGICGPVSGVLAGYGISRSVSRSVLRLSVPVRDVAGKLNEIVGPITLTARWSLTELETVLRHIADQIGTVVTRLQQSQRDALRAEQLAAVGQMAAGMAHELRNPLTAMKILIQAATDRGTAAVVEGRDLAVLEDEIARLEQLVQEFLDFARPPQLEKSSLEFRDLLLKTVDLVAARAAQQHVLIQCDLPEKPVVLQADIGQLRQVVLNLLLNALDALGGGGIIFVTMHQSGNEGWFILEVADTGPGLPAELGQRIFEPFVSTKATGLGLGLSISKRIVEAHGGQISATSRPAGGAVFAMSLPAAGFQTENSNSEAPAAAPEPTLVAKT